MLGNRAITVRNCWLASIDLFLLITCIGCGTLRQCANPDIHFILPNGYVGSFRMVLDEACGVDAKLENGRYVYAIPSEAELRVKTFDPLLGCHKENAAYQDGKEIPDANSNTPENAIALRGGIGSGSRAVNGKNVGPIILTY